VLDPAGLARCQQIRSRPLPSANKLAPPLGDPDRQIARGLGPVHGRHAIARPVRHLGPGAHRMGVLALGPPGGRGLGLNRHRQLAPAVGADGIADPARLQPAQQQRLARRARCRRAAGSRRRRPAEPSTSVRRHADSRSPPARCRRGTRLPGSRPARPTAPPPVGSRYARRRWQARSAFGSQGSWRQRRSSPPSAAAAPGGSRSAGGGRTAGPKSEALDGPPDDMQGARMTLRPSPLPGIAARQGRASRPRPVLGSRSADRPCYWRPGK
jgi:hypothetical protein